MLMGAAMVVAIDIDIAICIDIRVTRYDEVAC